MLCFLSLLMPMTTYQPHLCVCLREWICWECFNLLLLGLLCNKFSLKAGSRLGSALSSLYVSTAPCRPFKKVCQWNSRGWGNLIWPFPLRAWEAKGYYLFNSGTQAGVGAASSRWPACLCVCPAERKYSISVKVNSKSSGVSSKNSCIADFPGKWADLADVWWVICRSAPECLLCYKVETIWPANEAEL